MRGLRGVLSLALVVACAVGCGGAESASSVEDEMTGMWVTNLKGIYVVFNADGTYGKGYSAEQAAGTLSGTSEFETGTWSVEEGILTFATGDGFRYCSETTGRYEVEITDDGDEVLVTLIEDSCDKRTEDFPSGLTRHDDSEA